MEKTEIIAKLVKVIKDDVIAGETRKSAAESVPNFETIKKSILLPANMTWLSSKIGYDLKQVKWESAEGEEILKTVYEKLRKNSTLAKMRKI